jgi:GntR family transcriptional regulator
VSLPATRGAPVTSKYDRIAADLRRKIKNGDYLAGAKLPAETALAEQYKTSVGTMRKALDHLAAEGLVEKRHGIGNFVKARRQLVRRSADRYQWEKDRVKLSEDKRRATGATEQDTGLSVDELIFEIEFSTIPADQDLADAFAIDTGTPLLRRVYRTRSIREDAPLSLSCSYLVRERLEANPDLLRVDREPWPGGTQHQLYTIGIELDRIVDEIQARPPSPDEAESLGLGPGVSVLVIRKTSYATDGTVAEVADVVLPGDRTQLVFTTKLKRWRS